MIRHSSDGNGSHENGSTDNDSENDTEEDDEEDDYEDDEDYSTDRTAGLAVYVPQ